MSRAGLAGKLLGKALVGVTRLLCQENIAINFLGGFVKEIDAEYRRRMRKMLERRVKSGKSN